MPLLTRLGALAAAACLLVPAARAQSDGLWADVAARATLGASATATAATATTASRALTLDRAAMVARLATAPVEWAPGRGVVGGVDVPVPMPDGGTMWFRVVESSVMAPELQARYPGIRTYIGQGRDVASATARISLTPAGFAAMAMTPSGTVYVDPYALAMPGVYHAYYAADALPTEAYRAARAAEALLDGSDGAADGPATLVAPTTTNGTNLRVYRLAMAATGEYTAFHGGTKDGALAAIVTTMNRVNQVYERDLSVRMVLVANTDQLIYTDAATDPFSNSSGDLGANQTTIDAIIGSANYDIGHLVGTGGGGVAGLGVVCGPSKARGLTGSPQPVGDAFDIDYVAHEMGHQFRGNHSYNGTAGSCGGNRREIAAYEPGSGSTVMSYAGICGSHDLQPNSDPIFHAISLQELSGFIQTGGGSTCGTVTPTENDIPVVTAPTGITIPVRTPFTLTGAATDATPAALTYIWEQFDRGASPGGAPANGGVPSGPPFFRVFLPSVSPSRTFPQFNRLVAGAAPVRGEALPADSRTLNFRLTARDNRAGGGAIGDVTVTVVTDAGAGPFVITSPAAAGTLLGGSVQPITWDVANTDVLDELGAPDPDGVDVENVRILYSANGGATFTTLLESTPNTGVAYVAVPNAATSQGRFMIEAIGNVFFAVTTFNTTVTVSTASDDALGRATEGLSAVAPNPTSGTASFTLRTASAAPVSVAVYDALGRRVAVVHDGPISAEQVFSVDVSSLPAGVYVVRASGGTVSSQRFTVVR